MCASAGTYSAMNFPDSVGVKLTFTSWVVPT